MTTPSPDEDDVAIEDLTLHYPMNMGPHIQKVFAGEYNVDFDAPPGTLSIADVGANIGSFAIWAAMRWKGSTIDCYEPNPDNFKLLQKNTQSISSITVHNYALGNPENSKLFRGKNNCGEASFYDLGEQIRDFDIVETRSPEELRCDILKLDTEGSELDILTRLKHWPKVIMLEWHLAKTRQAIEEMLAEKYEMVADDQTSKHRGILKYIAK